MIVNIAETMERQHGGLVLSVDALTKTVYMRYFATLHFLTHLSAHIANRVSVHS